MYLFSMRFSILWAANRAKITKSNFKDEENTKKIKMWVLKRLICKIKDESENKRQKCKIKDIAIKRTNCQKRHVATINDRRRC